MWVSDSVFTKTSSFVCASTTFFSAASKAALASALACVLCGSSTCVSRSIKCLLCVSSEALISASRLDALASFADSVLSSNFASDKASCFLSSCKDWLNHFCHACEDFSDAFAAASACMAASRSFSNCPVRFRARSSSTVLCCRAFSAISNLPEAAMFSCTRRAATNSALCLASKISPNRSCPSEKFSSASTAENDAASCFAWTLALSRSTMASLVERSTVAPRRSAMSSRMAACTTCASRRKASCFANS
mmetsp:Transcript_17258/g.29386  ORF Transcript_17258/g.29386 Transcript_17258/m.29386 type:complete len:250 (-) Transcript_17258:82-831(-)